MPVPGSLVALLEEAELLLATAGGAASGLSTPTSDADVLALCRNTALPDLQRIIGPRPRLDFEHQTLDWFAAMERRLRDHAVSTGGGLSPFSFLDLRFLVRIGSGTPLLAIGALPDRLAQLREPLRCAAAELVSTRFVSCFEDVAGFVMGRRDDFTTLLAGELVQAACLLALLQTELVDLSPKWAAARCLRGADPQLAIAAATALRHLAAGQAEDPHGWGLGLLHAVNRILASGVCAARGWPALQEAGVAEPNPAPPGSTDIPWCMMGLVGHLACADVERNRILFVSPHYVSALAGGLPPPVTPVFRLRALA